MNLNDYQTGAKTTALYKTPLMYPALGLAGEFGELTEKLGILSWDYDAIYGELGDVLWYVANIANDADLTLSKCVGSITQLSMPEDILLTNTIPNPEVFSDLGTPTLGLHPTQMGTIFIGQICEIVKKVDRDANGILTSEKRESICKALGCMVYLLQDLAIETNTTLEKIAQANLDKLASRADRGTIHGDGDNR